jgi:hypothetical protein
MKLKKKRYAMVKKDAEMLFYEKMNRMYRPDAPFPKGCIKFAEKLKELQGKKLEIKKTYGDRIYLKYPKAETENGNKVVGIDMEKYLVNIKKGKVKKVI